MVKNEPVKTVRLHIKSVVPEIKTFIKNRESIIAPARFSPVDLLINYTDYLNLFSETRPPIRADVCLEEEKMTVSEKESTQRLACKRRKLSI
jgi:hypothetical protein